LSILAVEGGEREDILRAIPVMVNGHEELLAQVYFIWRINIWREAPLYSLPWMGVSSLPKSWEVTWLRLAVILPWHL